MAAIHPYGKRKDNTSALVGKDGRLYHEKIKELLDAIKDPAEKAQAKAAIAQISKLNKRDMEHRRTLTVRDLRSMIAETKAEKFLINAGYSRKEFEREYGFTFEDFIDEDNWGEIDGKKVFVMNGAVYSLVFDYSGKVLRKEEYVR